ncbi:uncharacterized protein [Zea mays]|uniref:uncharacterized protein n=1 Tax=Zea mays TaxID=4577 RepID=UPI0009AA1C1C|nr:uncharacterized protein LOC109941083 [Zea mays]|eukprot:XP_020397154.1 uncharacterized protein LOC109941083 [Zea mays]
MVLASPLPASACSSSSPPSFPGAGAGSSSLAKLHSSRDAQVPTAPAASSFLQDGRQPSSPSGRRSSLRATSSQASLAQRDKLPWAPPLQAWQQEQRPSLPLLFFSYGVLPFLPSASNGTTPPAPTLSRGSNSHGRPDFFFSALFIFLPAAAVPAQLHFRPWPRPIPPWPPSSLSRAPRNFQQRAPPLRCCRTSLLLPCSLVAQRAPSPTCAASCALQQHRSSPCIVIELRCCFSPMTSTPAAAPARSTLHSTAPSLPLPKRRPNSCSKPHPATPSGGMVLRLALACSTNRRSEPRPPTSFRSPVRDGAFVFTPHVQQPRLRFDMDREMMIKPVMWCQPQDAVGERPEEWT